MDERMDTLWTVHRYAKWKHETDEPTKAQENYVRRLCQRGQLPAHKFNGEWRIDMIALLREKGIEYGT